MYLNLTNTFVKYVHVIELKTLFLQYLTTSSIQINDRKTRDISHFELSIRLQLADDFFISDLNRSRIARK